MISIPTQLTAAYASKCTLRDLLVVWLEFERRLNRVPIIRRLEQGNFSKTDYLTLLRNLRPQVIEGARWITRAASSFTSEYADTRSLVIGHAMDEHRDYKLIESDFVKAGGELSTICNAQRNIGTEALSAYSMQQASHRIPLICLEPCLLSKVLERKWRANGRYGFRNFYH